MDSWITTFLTVVKRFLGRVVECLERRDCDKNAFGSKPTRVIVLYHWKRYFTPNFSCLAVLVSSSKFQSYLYNKLKKQIKTFNRLEISWHLRKHIGEIACRKNASDAFLRGRKMNKKMKKITILL